MNDDTNEDELGLEELMQNMETPLNIENDKE